MECRLQELKVEDAHYEGQLSWAAHYFWVQERQLSAVRGESVLHESQVKFQIVIVIIVIIIFLVILVLFFFHLIYLFLVDVFVSNAYLALTECLLLFVAQLAFLLLLLLLLICGFTELLIDQIHSQYESLISLKCLAHLS